MKKIGSIIFVLSFIGFKAIFAFNPAQINPQNPSEIQWKSISIDRGRIHQGKPDTALFYFTNTGKTPIILSSVEPVCHCTTADYTKKPVLPGKTGYVKAIFDADGIGRFSKSVNVKANNGESVTLTIYGEVVRY